MDDRARRDNAAPNESYALRVAQLLEDSPFDSDAFTERFERRGTSWQHVLPPWRLTDIPLLGVGYLILGIGYLLRVCRTLGRIR